MRLLCALAVVAVGVSVSTPIQAQGRFISPFGHGRFGGVAEAPDPEIAAYPVPLYEPNPAYPLRIMLRAEHNSEDFLYGGYSGSGQLTIAGQPTTYRFKYGCVANLASPREVQAQWLNPHKLKVPVEYPGNHQHTCKISVKPVS